MKALYVSIQLSMSCKIKESAPIWIRILTPPTTEHTSVQISSLPHQAGPCPSHSSSQGRQVHNELSSGLWGAGKHNSRDCLCNFQTEMSPCISTVWKDGMDTTSAAIQIITVKLQTCTTTCEIRTLKSHISFAILNAKITCRWLFSKNKI